MTLASEHIEISNRFPRHAEYQFQLGDMPQTPEKTCGAVAHYLTLYLRSVVKRRGWRNRSRIDLSHIAAQLVKESSDPDRIRILFNSSNSLRSNFYEN